MSAPKKQENYSSLMDYMQYLVGSVPLDRDAVNNSISQIDVVHREVHRGNFYTYSGKGTIASGTANALLFLVQPAVGTSLHFQGIISAKNSGWAEIYEDATVVGGATVTPKNNNRISVNTLLGTLTLGGTVTDFGVLLQSRAIGANAPEVRLGGESETRNEWILDPDYKYLVWFYADNGDTQVSLDFEAYEVILQ